jgi:putative DNA primase/helicase
MNDPLAEYDPWASAGTGTSTETGWPETTALPAPTLPLAVARELIAKSCRQLTYWRGDWYRWAATCWERTPSEAIERWVYQSTERAVYHAGEDVKPWAPTRKRVADVVHAMALAVCYRPDAAEEHQGRGQVSLTNGVLDLASRRLADHDPSRFVTHSLPFAWDPTATCPRWITFLDEVLEADPERIQLLQEWFGYLLCGGTKSQKILSMFGPRRCGKGTIIRILRALIGDRYVVNPPSLDSLAGQFGLEPLLGAQLAVLADVQWTGARIGEAVGVLLGISGEDAQTVGRKHRASWSGTLPVRFVLAGNDRPRFRNVSGALPGRLSHLQFRISFYGRENLALTGQLMEELAGIFRWALVGWSRLQARGGRFTVSTLAERAAAEVERQASPVRAFVQDYCAEEGRAELDVLYRLYERWRKAEDLGEATGKPAFSRDLQSAFPMVEVRREGPRSGRIRTVVGISIVPQESVPGVPGSSPAYPATEDDHHDDVSPVQGMLVPGVPGVPSNLPQSS